MQAVANLAVPIVMSAATSDAGFFDDHIWKWIVCSTFNILAIYEVYEVCFAYEEEGTGFIESKGSYYFQCPLSLIMIVAEWLEFCEVAYE